MVARLQDDTSSGSEHHPTGVLQLLQGPVLFIAECWFSEGGEYVRDRFSVLLTDDGVGIYEAKFTAMGNLPSDRRLSRTHEPDQDYIMDGPWEMHSRDSFAATGGDGQ